MKTRLLNTLNNNIFYSTVGMIEKCVEIPDDGKSYIWQDGEIKEYTPPKIPTKSDSLLQAENAYIDFCKSLGFEGKASTEEIQAIAEQQDDEVKALEIAVKALGLINEITQQGGNWNNIGEI